MLENISFFEKFKEDKIAIYGLGILTEELLSALGASYQVVGLLDGYRQDGMLFGKPILTMEKVIRCGVRLIIVAARSESCKVIARRIGTVCKEKQIALVDIYGCDLCAARSAVYQLSNDSGITKETLLEMIETYSVVSTDLFDTLIMRQTLFSSDVFEILDVQLRQRGIVIEDFPRKRLEGEKELCTYTVPTLVEIYMYIVNKYGVTCVQPEQLAEWEWNIDCSLVVPRKELCDLLKEVYHSGKALFIVSDSFYTKRQLAKLLEACGVTEYTDILSSCDYRTSKTQQLFKILLQRTGGKNCVHIGDSKIADVESAEEAGLTACHIYSGLELFERTGYMGLWEQIRSISNRIQMGMFVSRLFNSPFQFEASDNQICVKSAYDVGFLFFAPVVSSFVIWLYQQIQACACESIWFSARDGYLIKKLYDSLTGSTESVYFLTSRTAALRAGVENTDDIRYVEEMRFSGSLQAQVAERFGIFRSGEDYVDKTETYVSEILQRAVICKRNYQQYIKQLPAREGEIAFFDFVARGTAQMYVGRLIKNHLKGFYFLWQDEDYMSTKGLEIVSFCTKSEEDSKGIADNYYILEAVLTAPHPSVLEFNDLGEPCFARETRSEQNMQCIQACQNGIADYFRIYCGLCFPWMHERNSIIEGRLLSLIHKLTISDVEFLKLKVEDPFFNRSTSITDLL